MPRWFEPARNDLRDQAEAPAREISVRLDSGRQATRSNPSTEAYLAAGHACMLAIPWTKDDEVGRIDDAVISRKYYIVNIRDGPTTRQYPTRDCAKVRYETRKRIVHATKQLHNEPCVAATTSVDASTLAGTGAATVYLHFPKIGDLVLACSACVWRDMRPTVAHPCPGGVQRFTRSGRPPAVVGRRA